MQALQKYLAFIFTSGLFCCLLYEWLFSHWHSTDIECMLKHLSKVTGTSKMVLKVLTSDFSKMGIWSLMSMTCICTSQIVWNTAWKENKQHHGNPSAENNFSPKVFIVNESERCQIARYKQSPTAVGSTWSPISGSQWEPHSLSYYPSSQFLQPVSFNFPHFFNCITLPGWW